MTLQVEGRRTIQAIKTLYSGTLFRSRLEARWAATFDALKWSWEYEPIDLSWYIPDFLLTFPSGDVAVEVKPDTRLADLHGRAMHAVRAGWMGEVLALGSVLFPGDVIGVNAEPIDGGEVITGPAKLFRCINCGSVSFLNDDHGWHCRVNGCSAGNAHVGGLEPGELDAAWKQSGNRVQWRPGT